MKNRLLPSRFRTPGRIARYVRRAGAGKHTHGGGELQARIAALPAPHRPNRAARRAHLRVPA